MGDRPPQLEMELPSLADLPPVEVAEGYRLRTYQPGDESVWCRLVNECIGGEYTEEQCGRELTGRPWFDPADLFFVEHGGEAVGTACALRRPDLGTEAGYVHMVAVKPEHRGHGLGRALVLAVLHRFREMGFRAATLRTDDWRLAAIRMYLGLGFEPKMTDGSHEGRWREVRGRLLQSR